ncbi:predicted protein [Nematostella vectensis]|uniref:Photolyase/cryptochrome alpha/beta domain-containing protein n=1 Tax=Nematostella vectensis TaxID=45351 RepID=A7SZ19_NEMVE|nr:predicted protein [Nematostella vectensis]|eukprot:XP_001623146.1 predicted protein [Nematostella vectensis]
MSGMDKFTTDSCNLVKAKKTSHSIHWLRKGLRIHDNPALRDAVLNWGTFRVVYILDTKSVASSNIGLNLWRFLLQALEDLDDSLRKLNSRLFVIRGQPADVFPRLFREWGITRLTFEEDSEPFGKERDSAICMLAREAGVEVASHRSHTLYHLQGIIDRNGGTPPLTYKKFLSVIEGIAPPDPPVPHIDPSAQELGHTPLSDNHDELYGVPTMEELGLETSKLFVEVWHGGETEALKRLDRHLERKAWIASFGKPKVTSDSLMASPSGVSPYLRFGCLSPRLFYYRLMDLYRKVKGGPPPTSLYGQLLWREFFFVVSTNNPNFDKMESNPICLYIKWRTDKQVASDLQKWTDAQTGFPWIDAIMSQLKQEGWIHYLARVAIASFLTRGCLWISWEAGMKVFAEHLLDADWSSNAGNWMWWSYSAFSQQFFNPPCPVEFSKSLDASGDYIRKYLPVLKGFPARYIHEPWKAPLNVQKMAKCIIGKSYPSPMVDHEKAVSKNMEEMTSVYKSVIQYRISVLSSEEKQIEETKSQFQMPETSMH